jgi:predicted DNA-binding transcriptional regulator AlpA
MSDRPLSDYWGIHEIAAYLDIKPSTLTSYISRRQFPQPDTRVGATRLWLRTTVEAWAAQRPRKGPPS